MATGSIKVSSKPATNTTMPGLEKPRRYFAIFAISCGTVLMVMDGALPNVALPTISDDLDIESSSAILLVSVYQLVLVMSLLPLAALGGRIGLRKLYQLGLCLFIAASLLCFFAPNFPLLLAARALQALGAGAALSVASALIRSILWIGVPGIGILLAPQSCAPSRIEYNRPSTLETAA